MNVNRMKRSKLRLAVEMFANSRIPAALAYGLALMTGVLGVAFVAIDPGLLRRHEYGALFDTFPMNAVGVALTVTAAALAGVYRHDPKLAIFPAGLLVIMYSGMAACVALAPGSVRAAPDLFVLLLFAGYAAGVVSLTSGRVE